MVRDTAGVGCRGIEVPRRAAPTPEGSPYPGGQPPPRKGVQATHEGHNAPAAGAVCTGEVPMKGTLYP